LKRSATLILALLLVVSACREKPDPRPEALRQNLAAIRGAIRRFHADNGRYPHTLEELVPKHIAKVPTDPFTNTTSWRLITEESVQPSTDFQSDAPQAAAPVIIDVQSSAPGADANRTPYANY
jgi:general secretion pathway protein G